MKASDTPIIRETSSKIPMGRHNLAEPSTDTIFIGKKPLMAYATACMIHFNQGSKRLTLKARGRAISTAVDVAEVLNHRFFQGGLSENVHLGTEVVGDSDDARNVSTIEIILERMKDVSQSMLVEPIMDPIVEVPRSFEWTPERLETLTLKDIIRQDTSLRNRTVVRGQGNRDSFLAAFRE